MSVTVPEYNTTLSEFTYTVARNAPLSMKRHLPEKLYRKLLTSKSAMRFASQSSFEEKLEFFSFLGIPYYLIFADIKRGQTVGDLREFFSQFDSEEKPASTLKKLADNNVYICSNKELCYSLGHMAQLVDTKSYVRNQELVRASYNASNLKAKINIEEHTKIEEEKEDAAELVKLFSKVLWVSNVCSETSGVDSATLQVLMYLYVNRHAYVQYEKLLQEFAGSLSPRQLFVSHKTLIEGLMIQKHAQASNKSVTITGRGILVVNQFRDKVIKMLNF